jgi:hypothetical protein
MLRGLLCLLGRLCGVGLGFGCRLSATRTVAVHNFGCERARKRAPTRNLSTFGYVYVHEHVQVHVPSTLPVTVSQITGLSRLSPLLDYRGIALTLTPSGYTMDNYGLAKYLDTKRF